jgi:hypothetical protein
VLMTLFIVIGCVVWWGIAQITESTHILEARAVQSEAGYGGLCRSE